MTRRSKSGKPLRLWTGKQVFANPTRAETLQVWSFFPSTVDREFSWPFSIHGRNPPFPLFFVVLVMLYNKSIETHHVFALIFSPSLLLLPDAELESSLHFLSRSESNDSSWKDPTVAFIFLTDRQKKHLVSRRLVQTLQKSWAPTHLYRILKLSCYRFSEGIPRSDDFSLRCLADLRVA